MGEMSRWTFYQRFIAEHVTDTDPAMSRPGCA
jgi:hypothetical protein